MKTDAPSTSSPKVKPDTIETLRHLTPSEIDSLRADFQQAEQEMREFLAAKRRKTAQTTDQSRP